MMGAGDEDDFCPELPPHLLKRNTEVVSDDDFCPELPPHLQAKMNDPSTEESMCPQLPPKMQSSNFEKDNFSLSLSSNLKKSSRKSLKKSSKKKHSQDQQPEEKTDDFCPELPPHLLEKSSADEFCPQLPPHLQKSIKPASKDSSTAINVTSSKCRTEFEIPAKKSVEESALSTSSGSDSEGDDESEQFCPALPPHLKQKSNRILGPSLPPENYKPTISHSDEDSEEEMGPLVGPLPAAEPVDMDRYIEETIARRTKSAAEKLRSASDTAPAREAWMLELPADKPLFAGLALQPRQFARKAKTVRGDTSIWTDTPADKERKAQRAAERAAAGLEEPVSTEGTAVPALFAPEDIAAKERDERLQEMVDQYNSKKRPAPLVDTHLAKKKAVGDDVSVTGVGRDRKPFSRDDDLHVNKFDEAQRSSILKKAKQLNERFSSGKAAKFL